MASFVPRVIQRKDVKAIASEQRRALIKQKCSVLKPEKSEVLIVDMRGKWADLPDGTSNIENLDSEQKDESDDEPVISYSKYQRWPENGEPVCIVCGRYGAYICDQTEKDVCSLECKARHLKSCGIINNVPAESPTVNSAATEGCYEYKSHHIISKLTENQVHNIQQRLEIQTRGDNIPKPILEFFHCEFNEKLSKNITDCGYYSPTPIQMQVIPVALSGRDVMACAHTGSGKTAAFLLPMITRIHHITGKICVTPKSELLHHPLGLILAPTRELCMQIENQAKELMQGLNNMRTALLVGGMPLPPQIRRLQMGVQVVVATPGRLLEILSKDGVDLTHILCFVLDEVDSMLQLGFEQQVQQIIEKQSHVKQTLVVSATIPTCVETMASRLLHNPVFISVGNPSSPTQAVKQLVLWVEEKSKKKRLFSILNDPKHYKPPVVVFVETKIGADLLSEAVEKMCNIPCVSMHGDKPQADRIQIMQSFIDGVNPVIVCTGVLGRGVDLLNVRQVINFDMPPSIEEYIHQVGRAGRLGACGWAITFINNNNKNLFLDLIESLPALGITLPSELMNSCYATQQKVRRKQVKRKERDVMLDQGGLMDMLKDSARRKKR